MQVRRSMYLEDGHDVSTAPPSERTDLSHNLGSMGVTIDNVLYERLEALSLIEK
jgi:hypothetical protein